MRRRWVTEAALALRRRRRTVPEGVRCRALMLSRLVLDRRRVRTARASVVVASLAHRTRSFDHRPEVLRSVVNLFDAGRSVLPSDRITPSRLWRRRRDAFRAHGREVGGAWRGGPQSRMVDNTEPGNMGFSAAHRALSEPTSVHHSPPRAQGPGAVVDGLSHRLPSSRPSTSTPPRASRPSSADADRCNDGAFEETSFGHLDRRRRADQIIRSVDHRSPPSSAFTAYYRRSPSTSPKQSHRTRTPSLIRST